MKRLLIAFFFFLASFSVWAQSGLFLSHQALVPAYYNPASLVKDGSSSLTFAYRNQWTGYSPNFYTGGGAPNTQVLSFAVPIVGFPLRGVGLNISNDILGAENNFQIQVATSYEVKLNFGSLYLGVAPGLYSKVLKGNLLVFNNPEDPLNSGVTQSAIRPDLSTGLWYQSNQGYHIAVGAVNILEPAFDFGYDRINRTYIVSGGIQRRLNENLLLTPNVNIRTDLSQVTFDVGSMIYYQSKMWSGLSYRLEESLMLFLGYGLLNNKLKVGYAFEYVVYNAQGKNPTSHEIFIKYHLPDLVFGGRKSVKTPRFSY